MSGPLPHLVPLARPSDGSRRWSLQDGDRALAVFVLDGDDGAQAVVVLDDACPHRAGRLSEGVLRGGAVVCPSHFYSFDLRTGRCLTADLLHATRHAVVIVDGEEMVAVTPRATRSMAEVLRAHARGD